LRPQKRVFYHQSTTKWNQEQETSGSPIVATAAGLSAYSSGGQQICRRCEKIREHADAFLPSDDETLLYVRNRLRRIEKRVEGAERRAARRKALDRRMGRSGSLVANRSKRGELGKVNQVVADAQNALSIPQYRPSALPMRGT
jgi:hypothetical protein